MRFTLKKTIIYVSGLLLLGLTVSLILNTNLGVSSWDAFFKNLHDGFGIEYRFLNPAIAAILTPLAYLIQKKKFTWWVLFPVAISFFIGYEVDILEAAIPNVSAAGWVWNYGYLLASILVCAVGLNICDWCKYPMPALDELCHALAVLFKTSHGNGKLIGELLALALAVLSGLLFHYWNVYFNIGITTLVFALAIGPVIDLLKKPLNRILEAINS